MELSGESNSTTARQLGFYNLIKSIVSGSFFHCCTCFDWRCFDFFVKLLRLEEQQPTNPLSLRDLIIDVLNKELKAHDFCKTLQYSYPNMPLPSHIPGFIERNLNGLIIHLIQPNITLKNICLINGQFTQLEQPVILEKVSIFLL